MKNSKLLDENRKKINLIDMQIVSLIDERINVALNIGKIKHNKNICILDVKREKEILRSLKGRSKYLSYKEIETVYKTIFEISKKNQLK